jgi:hypothetical protein
MVLSAPSSGSNPHPSIMDCSSSIHQTSWNVLAVSGVAGHGIKFVTFEELLMT